VNGDGRSPRVAVVVVSYNTRPDLLRCLAALGLNVTLPLEVVVVDNASHDGSADAARAAFPAVRVIENGANLGFARANNIGLRATAAPYALILNSDAELRPGCLEALCGLLERRPELGAVGPRTLGADGRIQLSFGPALTPLAEWRQRRLVKGLRAGAPWALREVEQMAAREHEPDWLSASCLLARRAALDAVGGFDEGFFLYEEDVDLCVRLRRAGWRLLFTPAAEVVHQLGRSMEKAPALARLEYDRSHLRYYRKHNGVFWTLALRIALVASAGIGWLRALGPGAGRRERRGLQGRRARLALALPDA
jgi:N-acetylglucosaminyl-diphospho-decaprenol L-rhamnosyltransferase